MSIAAIHTAALAAKDNRMIEAARTLSEFRFVEHRPLGGTGDGDGAQQYLRALHGVAAVLEVGFSTNKDGGETALLNGHILAQSLSAIQLLAAMAAFSAEASELRASSEMTKVAR